MILIIDDEENILELLEVYLQGKATSILRAKSVPEALKLLQKNTFKLVISDIMLESGSGKSIHRYMRKKGGNHENTLLLLISGSVGDPGLLDEKTKFLAKPFDEQELMAAIKGLSSQKNKEALHPELKKILGSKS